jgi:hypothetical protein
MAVVGQYLPNRAVKVSLMIGLGHGARIPPMKLLQELQEPIGFELLRLPASLNYE